MTTPHKDNESLREQIGSEEELQDELTAIMYGADWKKQDIAKAFKPDVEAAMKLIQSYTAAQVREAEQKPVGDAIEIDVALETMQFVLSKIRLKPKTIADRLLMQEREVNAWIDGTADKYDLQVYIWQLKILAHLARRFNWMVFLLEPDNLPQLTNNQDKKG